jgi:hypothetical protein
LEVIQTVDVISDLRQRETPLPTSNGRMKRKRWIFAGIVTFCLGAYFGYRLFCKNDITSAINYLQQKVDGELRVGASRQKVIAWLDEQKIPHRTLADESIAAKVIMKGRCQAIEANVLFHFDEKDQLVRSFVFRWDD